MPASYGHPLGALVTALEQKTSPEPSLADGLRSQVIAAGATRSLRDGRPVTIDN